MLSVKTPEEVFNIIKESFPNQPKAELVPLEEALGRILFSHIVADEYVPDFDRSTVDGYAVRGQDTFGCSEAIPAILDLQGEILMGEMPSESLKDGSCMAIPTGGALPQGADAVVMLEYTEDFGDGTIAVEKPVAPGNNLIYRGDDVHPGKIVLSAGRRLNSADIGALAALGQSEVSVCYKPVVGIISTGDELVPLSEKPMEGQIRDVNSPMLKALVEEAGGKALCLGIIPDQEKLLGTAVDKALEECDIVVLSGGSSVGVKDNACRVIESRGKLLLHGIAMKPGKPTILGSINGKPVLGLPGHPVAAYFVAKLFLPALLDQASGYFPRRVSVQATLTETVSANHGRAQYVGVILRERCSNSDSYMEPLADFRSITQLNTRFEAIPIRTKSGLITTLAGSDGYFCIPRDCEGFAAGTEVEVFLHAPD